MSIEADRLRELLAYDPHTGLFRWRVTRTKARAGAIAGYVKSDGYVSLCVEGRAYFAHRLAWLHVHGQWPAACIDHINRDRGDNRISNLREATISQNGCNRLGAADSKSGVKGVWFDASRNRWTACIQLRGRTKQIGRFKTKEDAAAAYERAATELHGEFARVA
jgi:hypothetical protein